MWGVGVKTGVNENEQVSNAYSESQKYTDQSVKDTMIQNYITNITTRTENVTELTKNFTDNINAQADSIQKNNTKFSACLDIDGLDLSQSNTLIQNVKQGFEKLNQDSKKLKEIIDTHSETDIQNKQDSSNLQDSKLNSDQDIEHENKSGQNIDQKSTFTVGKYFNERFSGGNEFTGAASSRVTAFHKSDGHKSRYTPRTQSLHSQQDAQSRLASLKSQVSPHDSRMSSIKNQRTNRKLDSMRLINSGINTSNNTTNSGGTIGNKSTYKLKSGFTSIREAFDSLLHLSYSKRREQFCLFGCVDVQTAVNKSKQISNSTMLDIQTNIQTQDIYKKIDTAYDKTVETITKMSETVNNTTTSIASASAIQINNFEITSPEDACRLNLKNMKIDQKNELQQNVELSVAMKCINDLTSDNEVKAIMADMMGLTQSSDTSQASSLTSEQKQKLTNDNNQGITQLSENMSLTSAIVIIVIVIVAGSVFLMVKGGNSSSFGGDSYFDAQPMKKINTDGMNGINGITV